MCGTSTRKPFGCPPTYLLLLFAILSTESLRCDHTSFAKSNLTHVFFLQPTENGVEFRIWSREVQIYKLPSQLILAGWLRPNGVGVTNRTSDPILLRGLLQHLLPTAQAGHDCHPRLQCGRDGELGSDHLPRGGDPVRGGEVVEERQGIRGSRCRPRACPPGGNIFDEEKPFLITVVWRPCHHGVVDRLVAQRRVSLITFQ